MTKRVLITGSAGYLGSKFADLLAACPGYEIFGIDICEPKNLSAYKHFMQKSVTDVVAMRGIFEIANPDIAVHLAFVVTSTHDRRLEERVAIVGTHNFLDCVARAKIPKVIFLSSAAAYGAHDDNDVPLTEKSPIRGVDGYGYSRLKARADRMAQDFMSAHKECEFILLRPCLFIGPSTNNNFFDVLKYPLVPMISDYKGIRDPEFQFIHEDDMAHCLLAAVQKSVRGIYNVAGDGAAKFSELVHRFGKHAMAVPAWFLYPVTALLWRLHLVTSPPAQLDFIRYPWIMDVSKMQKELFKPQKDSIQAFDDFVASNVTN